MKETNIETRQKLSYDIFICKIIVSSILESVKLTSAVEGMWFFGNFLRTFDLHGNM